MNHVTLYTTKKYLANLKKRIVQEYTHNSLKQNKNPGILWKYSKGETPKTGKSSPNLPAQSSHRKCLAL